ncbi:MAG TPA: NADH-quinone oxidoreductase subunit H [bacterium]|nr:NADH-quinone oxidoreductase subunit H [bacterium]HOL67711.1 NADH-quinone oxidoreductase subunit H [bacterium]HPP11306.1 NADH-quinone oxidoreductase subunit H [bacterium]
MVSFLLWLLLSLVFFSLLGMLSGWVDRKITARIQWRVGPPWWQNFADLTKLTAKEVVVPVTAGPFFFLAPVMGVAAVAVTGAVVLSALSGTGGETDVIVIIYLLVIPSLALILAGSSSGNPLASVGIARELKLVLGYELPFILALLVPVVKTGTTRLSTIFHLLQGPAVLSFSTIVALLVALFALLGKLGWVPFDVSEAETEIASGLLIEYSGWLLALFKLMKWMLLATGITFLVFYFLGGLAGPLTAVVKYIVLLVVMVLIKNTNPRLRIDQAMKFFWGWLTAFSLTAILLAFLGW